MVGRKIGAEQKLTSWTNKLTVPGIKKEQEVRNCHNVALQLKTKRQQNTAEAVILVVPHENFTVLQQQLDRTSFQLETQ